MHQAALHVVGADSPGHDFLGRHETHIAVGVDTPDLACAAAFLPGVGVGIGFGEIGRELVGVETIAPLNGVGVAAGDGDPVVFHPLQRVGGDLDGLVRILLELRGGGPAQDPCDRRGRRRSRNASHQPSPSSSACG